MKELVDRVIYCSMDAQAGNALGAFSHILPEIHAAELKKKRKEKFPPPELSEPLPEEPVYSSLSGILLQSSVRIDGGSEWNIPEPILWDRMRHMAMPAVTDGVLDESNGNFVITADEEDEKRSFLVKFDGMELATYRTWGVEYELDPAKHDLLLRESAAYEVAKAMGMADLVTPLALRDADSVRMVGDGARERIASCHQMTRDEVDKALGNATMIRFLPRDAENFVEYWGLLANESVDRMMRGGDRVRHGLYRAYALDYVLGVEDRLLCSYLYNKNTDRPVLFDFGLSFPHPGYIAEKYLQIRQHGWGGKFSRGLRLPPRRGPATQWDLRFLLKDLDDARVNECLASFRQISETLTEKVCLYLALELLEHNVPSAGIFGMLMRAASLHFDPLSVLRDPERLTREIIAPIRRGFPPGGETAESIVQYGTTILSSVSGESMEVQDILAEPLPEGFSFIR